MNLPTLLKTIDPYVTPVALPAVRILSKLVPDFGSQKILCVRPGGMGDLILAQVALEHLGISPQSLCWLIEKRSAAWAKFQNLSFITYDSDPIDFRRYVKSFHQVINSEQRFGLSQVVSLLCKQTRGELICFDTNLGAKYADKIVNYDSYNAYEVNEFVKLFTTAFDLSLNKPFENRRRLNAVDSLPLVAIAGKNQPSRDLNLEQWTELIRRTLNINPFEIVCAPEDTSFANSLKEHFPKQANLITLPFDQLCQRVSGARELVTIDGGMVHVATYYGVPTTALFTSGRDMKWAPRADKSKIIFRSELPCRPCTLYGQVPPCPHNYACKNFWD